TLSTVSHGHPQHRREAVRPWPRAAAKLHPSRQGVFMAPVPSRARALRALVLAVFASAALAPAAHALRIVDYNITNYPSVNFPAPQPSFRTIFAPLNADVVVCQEVRSQAGVDSFRTNVLNVNEPGQWASATFFDGNDTDNALFYKPANVQVL